jgi:hypothetical protein
MSIAMLPFASLALAVPAALPAARLRLRTYSLCLACFFALINTSLPRLAFFVPAYERLAAVPKLDRTRDDRTALLPLARGILEVPLTVAVAAAVAVVECDDEDVAVDAARCAPSLAMMREREIRGLRVEDSCPGRDVDEGPGVASGPRRLGELCWLERSPVAVAAVAASAVAAAVSEVGLTGGGMTCLGDVSSCNGVVNIFPPPVIVVPGGGELAFPLRGLFVIASRTELRGGVLARCAMMLPVLDLTMPVEVTVVLTGLRDFARELAVGASNLDMVPLGLKTDALLLPPLPSTVLPLSSGTTTCAGFAVGTPPLRWVPKGAVDERETPRTL